MFLKKPKNWINSKYLQLCWHNYIWTWNNVKCVQTSMWRITHWLRFFAKNSFVAMAASALHPVFTGNTLNAFSLLGAIELSCWRSDTALLLFWNKFLCCFIWCQCNWQTNNASVGKTALACTWKLTLLPYFAWHFSWGEFEDLQETLQLLELSQGVQLSDLGIKPRWDSGMMSFV